LFDKKGTHYVEKAWIGSKFGTTQTISIESMETISGAEASFKAETKGKTVEGSVDTEFRTQSEAKSESFNKYSIGSSAVGSLEEWSASSKLNPEVVKMEVGSICEMLDSHEYNMTHCDIHDSLEYNETHCNDAGEKFNNWDVDECETAGDVYTHRRICYDVEINTCNSNGDGTDAPLYLSIYGKLGNEQEEKSIIGIYMNDRLSGNAFEAGDTDKFIVCDQINVGDIYEINIRGGWDDWKPANIKINGNQFNYGCTQEINYQGVTQELTEGVMTYNIVVQTENCGMFCGVAGNADVTLKIYGKFKGQDRVVAIEDLGTYSDVSWLDFPFTPGAVDNCEVKGEPILDTIDKISVQIPSYKAGDTWTIDKISINGQLFEFDYEISGNGEHENDGTITTDS